jgi:hypothetical protein
VDQIAIWLRMAEKWREAADEVSEPFLKRCYAERAASYELLAAGNGRSKRAPNAAPQEN